MSLFRMNRREWTVFFAGFVCAVSMAAGVLYTKWPARAEDPYVCVREALEARIVGGSFQESTVTVAYVVPTCFGERGFAPAKVSMYSGDDMVMVKYNNVN